MKIFLAIKLYMPEWSIEFFLRFKILAVIIKFLGNGCGLFQYAFPGKAGRCHSQIAAE